MKAYKIEILIIDHDNVGKDTPNDIIEMIENARFPNDCLDPKVKSIVVADIGEWREDHPLNLRATADKEYKRLFFPEQSFDDNP